MTYTLPGNETTTFAGYMSWANTATNGVFGIGLLFLIFSVIMIAAKRYGATTAQSWVASGLVTVVIAGLLVMLDVVSSTVFIILLMAFMFAYIWSRHTGD